MQAPVGAHSSSPKNQGWALTRRRCFNSPTMPLQAPTPDLKLTDRHYWIDSHHSFACACKQSQHGSWESCIVARKWTNLKSRHHGFATFVACSMRISYCKWRTLQMRPWLELSSHHARNLHGGQLYGGPHKPQNCQNWGVGPCLGMRTIRYMQIIELVYCFTQSLPKLVILKWCCKASDSCGGRHRTWYLRLIIHADDCLQSNFLKVFLLIVHWDWLTIHRVPTNIVGLLVCFLGCFFFFFSRPTAKPLKNFSTWLQVQCPSLQKQKIH